MLDKSVPYLDILMVRPAGLPVEKYELPQDCEYRHFKDGDEWPWSRIETSVLEFSSETAAVQYFRRDMLPYYQELRRRCLFVESPDGQKIATCTAWWGYTGVRREPMLHWMSVVPEYQGKGIGKALCAHAVGMICDIEGDRDIVLHTQTWSHRAVRMYEKLGFAISSSAGICGYPNRDYAAAVNILQKLYPGWKPKMI